MFNIEIYLQTYFEADMRVRAAELESLDARHGNMDSSGFKSADAAKTWYERVCAWRANTRAALQDDAVLAPGTEDRYWLLYIPCKNTQEAGTKETQIRCRFCRKCRLCLSKRDSRGKPVPAMPYYARARGMWGGPEPREFAALSYLERRVIQLARVYACVKRVLGKTVPWAKGNVAATPQYSTKNAVAYATDPCNMARVVCLLPEELCDDFAVQFVSSLDDAYQEPALQVNVSRLRAAIAWLAANSWPWMEKTKYLEILSAERLGQHLEFILAAYRASVGPTGEGVPKELLATATKIDGASLPEAHVGPADAAADGEQTQRAGSYSSAVIDTGLEDLTPLQLWSTAMSKYAVLEECAAILDSLGPEDASAEKEQALRRETQAIGEAVQALQRLSSAEVRGTLDAFHEKEPPAPQRTRIEHKTAADATKAKLEAFLVDPLQRSATMKLRHKKQILNSFDPDFWSLCFVDLFFRGDCKEKYKQHKPQLGGRKWIRSLLKRADFRGWSLNKEFAAVVANLLLRRAQMYAVYCYVNHNQTFHKNLVAYDTLTSTDFVAAALAAGDCNTVRDLLRKKGVELKVKTVLKSMDVALRDVEGSEAERGAFRYKFVALRIWNGCSFVFFTLNPHDIHNPLLIVFADANNFHLEKVSLDWGDADMREYYARVTEENALRLHEFAVEHPAAAAACVHLTFKLTIELLFNCAPPANMKPNKQHADGIPSRCEPGIFGNLAGYLGIVEPQMRWTEHLHMLMQLLGFAHPNDFFQNGRFVDSLRRVWCFVASIVFESQEGFAAYLGTPAAMETMQKCPLMEVFPKQREMLGPERAAESIAAQWQARGLSGAPSDKETASAMPHDFVKWTPFFYGDSSLSAAEWESLAVADSNAGARSCGNHVCRTAVCHKGRLAKLRLCRLCFWCWSRTLNKKGEPVMKRMHGKDLQPRWDGEGVPPTHMTPPHRGAPKLERNHAFHYKMTPGIILGPRCNHDVGILPKLPCSGPLLQLQGKASSDLGPCSGAMPEKEVDEQGNMSDISMFPCVHDASSSHSPMRNSMNEQAVQRDPVSVAACLHGTPAHVAGSLGPGYGGYGAILEKGVDEQENMSDTSMFPCAHDGPSSHSPMRDGMNEHAVQRDLVSVADCLHGTPAHVAGSLGLRAGAMLEKEVDEQENMSDTSMFPCVHDASSSHSPTRVGMNEQAVQRDSSSVAPCVHGAPALVVGSVVVEQSGTTHSSRSATQMHLPSSGEQDDSGKILVDRVYGCVGLEETLATQAKDFLHVSSDTDGGAEWLTCVDEMVEGIAAAEHYCVDYSSKEQPHAQGLLHTLHDSMLRAERFDEERKERARVEDPTHFDGARRLLQSLVAATNRRIHKGFPSIYAYLLGRPNHYCSHEFVKYSFTQLQGKFVGRVFTACREEMAMDVMVSQRVETEDVQENTVRASLDAFLADSATDCNPAKQEIIRETTSKSKRATHVIQDYDWRPEVLEHFPLYFFQAATDISYKRPRDGTYAWYERGNDVPAARRRHPCYARSEETPSLWVRSTKVKDRHGKFAAPWGPRRRGFLLLLRSLSSSPH